MGAPRQRDFRFFLKSQGLNLAKDADVQKMVELCFSKKNRPGLETTFWRFENVAVGGNPELKKEVLRKIISSDRSLGAVARIIIDEMVRLSGNTRACAVFPVDIKYIPELIAWFPDCRILHITRDPRAIAMSKTNDPTGTAIRVAKHPRLAWAIRKATTLYVINEYRKFARFHRRFEGLENYRLFRYEDLLVEPEKVLREVCDFVGCEFTPDMLEPEKGAHEHQASSLTGKKHKSFDPKAALRWQEFISSLDRWMITLFTGSSMKDLDYNPSTHPVFRKGAAI
jgi:Sulfotransferase family